LFCCRAKKILLGTTSAFQPTSNIHPRIIASINPSISNRLQSSSPPQFIVPANPLVLVVLSNPTFVDSPQFFQLIFSSSCLWIPTPRKGVYAKHLGSSIHLFIYRYVCPRFCRLSKSTINLCLPSNISKPLDFTIPTLPAISPDSYHPQFLAVFFNVLFIESTFHVSEI
jgi:hypothetical protein